MQGFGIVRSFLPGKREGRGWRKLAAWPMQLLPQKANFSLSSTA